MRRTAISLVTVGALLTFVTVADSEAQQKRPTTLLKSLGVGDQVTLEFEKGHLIGSVTLKLLTTEEAKALRVAADDYAIKYRDWLAGRRKNQELLAEARQNNDQTEVAKLHELDFQSRRAPSRPDKVYQISAIGDDYLEASDGKVQILIAKSSIGYIVRSVPSATIVPSKADSSARGPITIQLTGPSKARVGQTVDYSAKITNEGDVEASVEAGIGYGPSLVPQSASPHFAKEDGGLKWAVRQLQPRHSETLTVRFRCVRADENSVVSCSVAIAGGSESTTNRTLNIEDWRSSSSTEDANKGYAAEPPHPCGGRL